MKTKPHAIEIRIVIVSSESGGTPGETDSYSRDDTISRAEYAVADAIRQRVPADHLCSIVFAVNKAAGRP